MTLWRRTFKVVYTLAVEDSDANLHARRAATQEVNDIPDVLRCLGLLLHGE